MQAEMTLLVRPEHLNHHGFLFGGKLLAWLDEQAYIAGMSLCKPEANLVTVGIDRVEFKVSVYQGEMIRFRSHIVHVGRSSLTVFTQVMRHPDGAEIFSAYTTMVNRGSDGRPVPVEPLFYQAPWKPLDDETRKHQEIVERMRQRRQRG